LLPLTTVTALSTETKHVLLLRVAQALPVKALIAGTHTPAAIPALVHLTNPPARALDGEKFQLLCHAHLPKATNNYSEDVKCLACKGFTTEMRIPTGKGGYALLVRAIAIFVRPTPKNRTDHEYRAYLFVHYRTGENGREINGL